MYPINWIQRTLSRDSLESGLNKVASLCLMWCREQVITPQSWELQYLISVSDIIWTQVLQELILLRSLFTQVFSSWIIHLQTFDHPSALHRFSISVSLFLFPLFTFKGGYLRILFSLRFQSFHWHQNCKECQNAGSLRMLVTSFWYDRGEAITVEDEVVVANCIMLPHKTINWSVQEEIILS